MRVSRHNGRSGKHGVYNPKHNDRRFNVQHSDHIDSERKKKNLYWDCYQGIFKDENPAEMTFEQVEEKFYEEIFADFIKGQNARNIKNRHPERNRTAKDLLNDKRTCPEETIYQIGNIDSSIDYFDLYCICQEFFDFIERLFGKNVKIVRTMPNTPALVGEGMTAACPNEYMTKEEIAYVLTLLESFGRVEIIPERLMDTVVSVSGSSPAYVFMFIEAMADAAVSGGMPRAQAYQFAAQAVLGSAKMVLETGKHPGELKDMVCSPAGTTIEAVRVLEEKGFRSSVIEAMKTCEEISKSM